MTKTKHKPATRRIRGQEGMGVFLREDGYWVEWFTLAFDPTRIIDRMGPFLTRDEAIYAERAWRRDQEEIW